MILKTEIYTEHCKKVQIYNESVWLNNPYYPGSDRQIKASQIRRAVKDYLDSHPDTKSTVSEAMNNFTIITGMTKTEAAIIVGNPSRKRTENDHRIWVYTKDTYPFIWYYKKGKLIFKNDILIDIEIQHIDIYK
jgi:hypothetical protein